MYGEESQLLNEAFRSPSPEWVKDVLERINR